MRTLLAALSLVSLTACGQADVGNTPDEPVRHVPTSVPVADGPVRTRTLVTVMDTGNPELCLGAVAESYPPQCGGPAIKGWDWAGIGRGMHETAGKVRWGMYALTGTWDGTSFTATDAVPGALYDPPAETPPLTAPGPGGFDEEQLQTELRELPGYLGGFAQAGRMHVEVMYDDGTLQDFVDAEYGDGVVVLTSALVDVS